jgi:hypothetical protein
MRDIIHIGYPRTATTWFQNQLFPLVQNYTFLPRSILLETLFVSNPENYKKDWIKNIPENSNPILISDEMICGKIRAGSINLILLKEYAQRIKETFDNPRIVLFLRRQPDIIYSFYNLYIKKGGTFSFSRFIRQDLCLQETMLFSIEFFRYTTILNILEKEFGRQNIRIYLYEEFAETPKIFIRQFCADLDLQIDPDRIKFSRENSGYTTTQRAAKRFANRFANQGIPFKQYYINLPFAYKILHNVTSVGSIMPENYLKQIEPYMDGFARSNQLIMQDYQLWQMKKYNYPL